jgi:hypothetical protein
VLKKSSPCEQSDTRSALDLLLAPTFAEAFSVWDRHNGVVAAEILLELDRAGDWLGGTAVAVMARLTRSAQLRNQLRKRCR